MAFGIQNLGVINQKQAPAIWESDYADFPGNFIPGRICIALDAGNAGIYIDGTVERFKIADGATNFTNGLKTIGLSTPTNKSIGLGGELVEDVQIGLDNTYSVFIFGSATQAGINANGHFVYNSLTQTPIACTTEQALTTITPDVVLIFDIPNVATYKVLAEKI